jgi:hypothetical protein
MKTLLSAAAVSMMIGSAAWATPVPATGPGANSTDIVKVHYRDYDHEHHYTDDRDYRYDRRSDRRECYRVGPVQYCE